MYKPKFHDINWTLAVFVFVLIQVAVPIHVAKTLTFPEKVIESFSSFY